MSEMSSYSHSKMCLWNWQKGVCLQEIDIPRSQNYTSLLLQPNLNPYSPPRIFSIAFEKVGGTFLVLESSSQEMSGGGYRVSIWNLNRQQHIEQVAILELELQGSALGITILP